MRSLITYLKENLINEGGNVFTGGSDPIARGDIQPTIDYFISELSRIFPKAKRFFKDMITLGSVGKKDISGDIDLALPDSAFKDIEDWRLDSKQVTDKFALYKKRARTAEDLQLMKRAVIVCISEIINKESKLIITDTKQSGSGVLFCQFPQFTKGGENGKTVQIDVNFGDLDWLKFAYYSDAYAGNVKGLHRTQLMLTLFANHGYVFSHNYGVKNKLTNKIVADKPEDAIDILNKEYKFHLTNDILNNYFKLHEYLKKNLKEEELNQIYNTYLKILDSTRCDIPEDMQAYWVDHQDELGLTGKFLPNNSNLIALKK